MLSLHVTDTRRGAKLFVRGAPPGWTRSDDHHTALRTALGPAVRDEVDRVVHAGDLFDHSAAEGFIKIWGLPIETAARKAATVPEPVGR